MTCVPIQSDLQVQASTDEKFQEALCGYFAAQAAHWQEEASNLRRENLTLRCDAGYWESRFRDAKKKQEELQQRIEELEAENRKLNDRLYDRKSEKSSRKDRSNELNDDAAQQDQPDHENNGAKPKRKRGQQPNKPGPKRRDYSHLEAREDPPIEIPEDQRLCGQCGKPLTEMSDTEDSEQIEIEYHVYRRVIRRRRYRRQCECPDEPKTLTAPPPPKLIPKGRYGISLWVELLLNKYHLHQPINRQQEKWRLYDLDLSPGTIAGGSKRLVELLERIYEAHCDRSGQDYYKQADETRWLVFLDTENPTKQGRYWWLWAFLGTDAIAFRLDPSRSHEVPENHYPKTVIGYLMVDRYSSYKAIVQVKEGELVLVFCWAHVRRDFVEVGKGWPNLKEWALLWLQRIRTLYRLNRERLRHDFSSEEFRQADAKLREHVEFMHSEAERELADKKLHPACRKKLESLMEHWEGLTHFVNDPLIPMDNNRSERILRGPAVGRNNYYGSGSLWSGRLAAMLFSIFATLRLWGLNPRLWLQWFLESCAAAGDKKGAKAPDDIDPFLPWKMSEERRSELRRIDHCDPEPEAPDTS